MEKRDKEILFEMFQKRNITVIVDENSFVVEEGCDGFYTVFDFDIGGDLKKVSACLDVSSAIRLEEIGS